MLKKLMIAFLLVAGSVLLLTRLRQPVLHIVDTIVVTRGDIASSLSLTGKIINDHTVTITALLDGEITAIQAREGAKVKANESLSSLDSQRAKAMLDKAVAELEFQRHNLELARRTYQRNSNISSKGNLSRQVLEDSLLTLRSAQSAVKVAESSIKVNRLNVNNAIVRAPFDGTVIEQSAEVGQWVEAGTKLFTLTASDGNVIEAQVDAGDSARVVLHQPVVLSSDAWPELQWNSTVDWIAPAITLREKTSNSFAIRISLGDSAPRLLLGQQLDVELELDSRQGVLFLPLQALLEPVDDTYFVFTIERGVATRKKVETGLITIDYVEILSGLVENEAVIVLSGSSPKEGDLVEIR